VEPVSSGSALVILKQAYPLVRTKVISSLLTLAQKPIKGGVQKFRDTYGVPSPELEGLLQVVIAQAFLSTVKSITADYLEAQKKKILRTQEDLQTEKQLGQRLKKLLSQSDREIAPEIQTINFLPVEAIDEDHDLQQALLTRIKEHLGELPEELENRFGVSLLPTLRYNLWLQLIKALEDPKGKTVLVALFIQSLSRIEGMVDAERQALEITNDLISELSRLLSEIHLSLQRAANELSERVEFAKADYRRWLLTTNSTFPVPGLNVRLPINDAWDEICDETDEAQPDEQETLARRISRYHEWERLAEKARRDSESCHAEDKLISESHLIITSGAGSGKSPLSRKLAVGLTELDFTVMRVSLQKVALLTKSGVPFESALRRVALDGSGIAEEEGKYVLSSPDYLIADGLDETDPHRAIVANELVAWSSGHQECHVCVMTRPVGHTVSLLPGFVRAELLPLNDTAIENCAARMIKAKVSDIARQDELISKFKTRVDRIRQERGIASIAARNPLLLSFLVSLFLEGKELSNRRSELFGQVVELIRRGPIGDRLSVVESQRPIAERVIEVAAWNLIGNPDLNLKVLMDVLSHDIAAQTGQPRLAAEILADEALRFWEERGLIERLSFGSLEALTFVLLSLGEYLAGRYVSQMPDQDLRSWLTQVRREARWRQPLLLASGTGAADRIIPLLLQFDDPNDPVSTEAMLAASAIFEAASIDEQITERVIENLRKRLTSKIPLVAIEAGEGLRQIAPLAPEVIDKVTASLVDHEQEWTRLAVATARLAADKGLLTKEQTQRMLSEMRLVRRFHFARESAEMRISDLPEQAFDLQEFCLLVGIEKILAATHPDEQKTQVRPILRKFRHNMPMGLLIELSKVLADYDAEEVLDELIDAGQLRDSIVEALGKESSGTSPDVVLLESILAVTEFNATTDEGPSKGAEAREGFVNLSALVSALGFVEVGYSQFHALAQRQEEPAFQEVLRGTILALSIDPKKLNDEARKALLQLQASTITSITEILRHISISPDWSKAIDQGLDASKIVSALAHPSSVVVIAAVHLLNAGVGGDQARTLLLDVLKTGTGSTLAALAYLVPRIWPKKDALRMLVDRLTSTPVVRGSKYLYGALAKLISAQEEKRRVEIIRVTLMGLMAGHADDAKGAAEALFEMRSDITPKVDEQLQKAFEYWSERGSLCSRCEIVVHGSGCPQCHIVPPNPRAAILKLQSWLGYVNTEELLPFCEDSDVDVSGEAYKALTSRASADRETFRSLLSTIKNGLESYHSSTALNLLNSLLTLPVDTLSAVEPELLSLTDSEIPAVRVRAISSLTGSWVNREVALERATAALKDEVPAVRNAGTKTLRLLHSVRA
jgi:hypothetical protein